RRRHTRSKRDWSSDVCSSDLQRFLQILTRCLQMRQNLEKALMVLAQAQFAQADFAGAAASYRKILEVHGWRVDLANSYALSLAEIGRASCGKEGRSGGWAEEC